MIDTDKYEGHTPADQWTTHKMGADNPHHAVRFGEQGLDLELKFGADARLIADAPLLLAEVERHRPPKVDGKYMTSGVPFQMRLYWSDSHPKHDRRTWIEQVMEGITDVGYWTWVNWQLQYGEEEVDKPFIGEWSN